MVPAPWQRWSRGHIRGAGPAWTLGSLVVSQGARVQWGVQKVTPGLAKISLLPSADTSAPTWVFMNVSPPGRQTETMGGEKSIMLMAQPGPLVTNQGLPGVGEQRSCQSSLLLHRAPVAAQVATKVPQHVATSELPLTTTTQGRRRQGLVLPGW